MEPLSRRKRKFYFYGLIVLFLILIPILLLYAGGFRITKNWKILETGGIYLFATEPNSQVYLNGILERETNFYGRGVFIQNLKPGHYSIQVSKQGFYPWSNEVEIRENLVKEEHALLIPFSPKVRNLSEKESVDVLKLFLIKTLSATSTEKDVLLSSKNGELEFRWIGESKIPPSFFCNSVCESPLVIWQGKIPVTSFDFYPNRNDAIVFAAGRSLYAMQVDGQKNAHLVYEGESEIDFRLDGKILYIKDGNSIFSLEL